MSDSQAAPARNWVQLSASTANLSPRPRAIFCQAAGTFTATGENGVALPFTLSAGQELPIQPVTVTAIASGTFYGIY